MVTVLSTTQGAGHGAESVLCEMLAAWPTARLPLRIVAPGGSRVLACAGDMGFAHLALESRRDALFYNGKAFWRALGRFNGADLVHAWSARSFEFAWWLKHRLGVPASGTLHDHPHADFHGRVRRQIMKCCGCGLDALVAVSDAVSFALKEDNWSVPLSVIRNGLSDHLPTVRSNSTTIHLGFVGVHASWKGAGIIAKWIETYGLPEGVVWHLYGTPSPVHETLFRPLMLRWPGRILMEGHRETREIFRLIDVLVHASTSFDPLPTVLIEAARGGIPCVASYLGGAPEVVIDGKTGLLFDPSSPQGGLEALQLLIHDSSKRLAMGQAARHCYEEKFRSKVMVDGYERFWNESMVAAGKKV